MEKRSRWPYRPTEVMLPPASVKRTRTEYASWTTIGNLASSYRSCLPTAVSAPMQGKQSMCQTRPTCESTFGSAFTSHSASSFLSTVLRGSSRILRKRPHFISVSRHRVVDPRLTLKSQTIDQHRPALVGCSTHVDTTSSQMLPSV